MRFNSAVASALLVVGTNAQYINIPLQRHSADSTTGMMNKRQIANGSLTLTDQGSSYVANISFGTPGQSVQLILDTGSPLTWVNSQNVSTFTPGSAPTSAEESAGAQICAQFQCLNPADSSSLTVPSNSTIFDIQYVDGTESIGEIVQDTMTFEGLTDTTFEFGLVEYFYSPGGVSSALSGILGLSPPNPVGNFNNLSAALTASSATSYFTPQTILQQLQNEGAINSVAFSLYLSDSSNGQLTLGGVDSSRYTGPLTVLPIETDPSSQGESFYVTLNSVGFGGQTSNEASVNQLVVLDSGTTSMYLPYQAVEQLADSLNGYFIQYDSSSGLLAIPCSTSTTIDFYFSNSAVIRVPTSEILESQLTPAQARRSGIKTNSDICVLSLFGTAESDSYLLGDSFLRSAYVVYDTAQGEIAIAQAAYDQTSNITAIEAGEFGIPGAVYNTSSPGASDVAAVPSVTRTVSLQSGGAVRTTVGAGGTLTFTASSSAEATSTGNTASSASRTSGIAGSTYVVLTSGALIIAGILFV